MLKNITFTLFTAVIYLTQGHAQDTTRVEVTLEQDEKGRLPVSVYPPKTDQSDWTFIIPEIIPGTYMMVNYRRFYHNITAYDAAGHELKTKRKDNYIYIRGKGSGLHHLEYEVGQSLGDGKIWDNILTCAGTIFTDSSYLFNFQLVNGYFEGYERSPFKISFAKEQPMHASGALKAVERGEGLDVFHTQDYAQLIDQPVLYATTPDTASVVIDGHTFKIAVHAERNIITSEKLKPSIHRIMNAVRSFSGFSTPEDYYFIFYYVDPDRLKGLFKTFGMGSALEHNQSSVYYFGEYETYDPDFSNLDWIGTHEYLHTITPLTVHSEKIEDFDFAQPDMSRHLWLYEGSTDYFSALLNSQHGLSNKLSSALNFAIYEAEKRKLRSMTESSEDIIKKNMFSFINKVFQLSNFYEKGKLISFGIDMELAMRSKGELRLLDVLLQMKKDLEGRPFDDNELIELLTKYTYPEMRGYYVKYIEGKELVPYQQYLNKLGWTYIPSGSKVRSYAGKINIRYNTEADAYTITRVTKNTLGLKKGDIITRINGVKATLENARQFNFFSYIYWPQADDELILQVQRDDQYLTLNGKPELCRKIKYSMMDIGDEFTAEQLAFRAMFFKAG